MGNPFICRHRQSIARLYLEDCIGGMERHLQPGSVDVVVTSPPYNIGSRYGQYDDTLPRAQYLDWLESWGQAVSQVLAEQGSVFLNIGAKPSDPWGPMEVVFRLRQYFVLQNVIHWIKSIAIDREEVGRETSMAGNLAVGHYKPINSRRFVNDCHEYIFHLTKTGRVELDRLGVGVEYQDKSNQHRWGGGVRDRRCRGNTWFVPYKTIRSRQQERPHPATFPVKIPRMCIQLHGRERTRLVLDPFLGLGHTALACRELGVDFAGFEIDPDYFAEAGRLLQSHEPGRRRRAAKNPPSLFDGPSPSS
ncbi:MAG: site-specific DNA-methyltransferase [Candidatus Latescibacteria bacterium]|nr:site-specific DNA-methyltransferase [Candidatus Latescibacterota bacterium]